MPEDIGRQYDDIAPWWNDYHKNSDYGVAALERALNLATGTINSDKARALDVGCGSGGRLLTRLEGHGFHVTGLDASKNMIKLAQDNHPKSEFIHGDIRHWQGELSYDFILAWDSLFHLPLKQHQPVLSKLCRRLSPGGIIIYTLGDDRGEHTDKWRGQEFYYSSIGVQENIEILHHEGLSIFHLERDQYPDRHVYMIAQKIAR